jgi:nucleoside-diphosphate-sugar epimerase
MNSMKILVTGATGFIGSHAAERLSDLGHKVIGVDNFSDYYDLELKQMNANSIKKKGVEVVNLDLRDHNLADALPLEIDYICHGAAQPGMSTTSTFEE